MAKKKGQESKKKSNSFKRQMLIYISLVSVCSILFFIMSNQVWFEPVSKKILNAYAHFSGFILNIFGQNTSVVDGNINSSAFSISIRKGCDAIAPMALYIFAISFFPTNYKHKLKGVIYGIAILAIVNTIRIVSLYLIGKYTNETIFDIMHVDIWQIFFIIITLFIWVQWLKNTSPVNQVVDEKA